MNKKLTAIFQHLMKMYKDQYDRCADYRKQHDEDQETYLGYRDPNDYPLVYNESFNKVLPIIYTLLSRFMDQTYQTNNIVSVKPRKNRDLEKARAVEAILNFQLEGLNNIDAQGGSYLTMFKWFFNNITFGKGIAKSYWRKEERIGPKRMAISIPSYDRTGNFQGMDVIDHVSQEMQTVYDAPYVEVLHNKLCVPHPEYKDIQKMPAFFLVYKRSIDYIRKMVLEGHYRKEGLSKLGWDAKGGASEHPQDSDEKFVHSLGITNGLHTEEFKSDRITPKVDILECYTKLIIDSEPYSVGSGLQIKGREEEVIVHIGNYKTILSIQRNPYGIRPLFDIGCYMNPELYWDISLCKLTRGIQTQFDNLANLRMQDAMMKINTMIRVDPDSDVDEDDLVWRPFGIVPAIQGEVEPLPMPDFNSNIFQEQETFFHRTIQDLMGMYDYNMGQTPERQERVGVVYGIQSMGEARAKLMMMSMDHMGIRPLMKYMMILNTFHLPPGFEYRITEGNQNTFGQIFPGDLHPDYDYAARYTSMEPPLGKQARYQQMIQLASVLLQNPWINQYQWLRTIFELGDVREAEYLLKKPQQFAQEMQQNQQAAMMAEQMKQRYETEGKLITSQKDFTEETALSEQKFQHDMVLTALENEMKDEETAAA